MQNQFLMEAGIPIYHTQNRFIKMEVGIKGRNCKKVARKNNWKTQQKHKTYIPNL